MFTVLAFQAIVYGYKTHGGRILRVIGREGGIYYVMAVGRAMIPSRCWLKGTKPLPRLVNRLAVATLQIPAHNAREVNKFALQCYSSETLFANSIGLSSHKQGPELYCACDPFF